MGIKIKNLQTGEFEKFNIPALKGEKGEPGEIEPSEKVDYIGKQHSKLRDTMNANVDYIIKTAIGEFNYLDYEGQHITATNSVEGHAKSAILKGQTLVNLFQGHTFLADFSNIYTAYNNGVYTYQAKGDYEGSIAPAYMLGISLPYKPIIGKTYTMFVNQITGGNARLAFTLRRQDGGAAKIYSEPAATNGLHKFTFTHDFEGEYATVELRLLSYTNERILEFKDIMIIEGDWTNVDIPYFTGMQSVKMPVLTTTGKNLFDGELSKGYLTDATGQPTSKLGLYSTNYMKCSPNSIYTISGTLNDLPPRFYFYDSDKNYLGCYITSDNVKTCTTLSNAHYMRFRLYSNNEYNDMTSFNAIQVEQGSTATSYEPYKTNILHTPEEVVLKGIGDLKDTLNCNTGEYVQRIGEDVYDGSENWFMETNENWASCRFKLNKTFSTGDYTTDNIITNGKYVGGYAANGGNTVRISNNAIYIFDETLTSLSDFKNSLQQNPLKIQYKLQTPIVKTVDLSDNHVYSHKDVTHYDCSSAEGSLVPTLSVKVPTDTQLTIQEQKATTQTLLIKNMDLQQSIKEVQAMNLAFNTALYSSFNSIREEVEDIKKHVSTNENLEGSF